MVAGTVTSIGTGIAGEAAAPAITRTRGEGRSRRVVSTTGRAMQARTVVALAPRTRHVGGGRGHRTSVADQGRPGAAAGRPGAAAGRPGAAAGRRTVAGKVADRGRRNATVGRRRRGDRGRRVAPLLADGLRRRGSTGTSLEYRSISTTTQVNAMFQTSESFGVELNLGDCLRTRNNSVSFRPVSPPPLNQTMKVSLIDSISSKAKPTASSTGTRDKLAQVRRYRSWVHPPACASSHAPTLTRSRFALVRSPNQTKLREKELKEARKLELAAAKQAKQESRAEHGRMLKEERMTGHDTRRARTDRRRAEAAAERRDRKSHEVRCEHGIVHCKLCASA